MNFPSDYAPFFVLIGRPHIFLWDVERKKWAFDLLAHSWASNAACAASKDRPRSMASYFELVWPAEPAARRPPAASIHLHGSMGLWAPMGPYQGLLGQGNTYIIVFLLFCHQEQFWGVVYISDPGRGAPKMRRNHRTRTRTRSKSLGAYIWYMIFQLLGRPI